MIELTAIISPPGFNDILSGSPWLSITVLLNCIDLYADENIIKKDFHF